MKSKLQKIITAFGILALSLSAAKAIVSITIEEVDGSIVVSMSGSVNTDGLAFDQNDTWSTVLNPNVPIIEAGPDSSVARYDAPASGVFSPIGDMPQIGASSTTGTFLGFNSSGIKDAGFIAVPNTYSSGDPISGTATFAASFADAGLTPGYTQTISWGSGASSDTATLTIVPEAGETSAILGCIAVLAAVAIRRRRRY